MSTFNFNPYPVLETERLLLRRMDSGDDNEVFALRSDKRVQEFIDRPDATSIEEARQFIIRISKGIDENKWLYWGLVLKGQPKIIGTTCLWNFSEQTNSAEVGYELLPDYQGKGLMQEALVAVISFAFNTLKLTSICAVVLQGNVRSVKILEKNGFLYNREQDNTRVYLLTKK